MPKPLTLPNETVKAPALPVTVAPPGAVETEIDIDTQTCPQTAVAPTKTCKAAERTTSRNTFPNDI